MRLAIGGIEHETSSYNPRPTRIDHFDVLRGPELEDAHRGVRSAPSGMLEAAAALGMHAVPLLHAQAEPGGVIDRAAYELLSHELLERLTSADADAVGLLLHGAGLVEGIGELELDLARGVRSAVGRDVPVVATLDLHANNVTRELLELIDVALGCHLYPHTDFYERGGQAVRLLPSIASGNLRPVGHVETLPMVMRATPTTEGLGAAAVERCAQAERAPEILDCTIFHGFMHADWPTVGTRVVVYANDSAERAAQSAREVAAWLWDQRAELYPPVPEAAEAVALARGGAPGLVLLHEMSDNPGGGASGDGTLLLREMLSAGLERACFAMIADPESVRRAHAAGSGAAVELEIGGKTDSRQGEPIQTTAIVKSLSDGRFALQNAMWGGRELDLGPMACVRVDQIDVLLATKRSQVFDPGVLQLHGIEIETYRFLGIKSEHHFRDGFAGMWSEAIPVDGPGLSSVRFDRFPRSKTCRPIWPLDEAARYAPRTGP
jgi:microcystin degradation protein MlrC